MRIGNVELKNRLILAPMAGVTDLAFRQVCRAHGAGLTGRASGGGADFRVRPGLHGARRGNGRRIRGVRPD